MLAQISSIKDKNSKQDFTKRAVLHLVLKIADRKITPLFMLSIVIIQTQQRK